MALNSLEDLFVEQIRDLYDAEKQLVKALPKMAKAASAPKLKTAFEEHLEETRNHVDRLEQVFNLLGHKPRAKKCAAMEGMVEEGGEMIKADCELNVKDAGLIACAQRVEHYEIAGYGCVRTWAHQLGQSEAARLLEETLREEKHADETLNTIAE
ncbi:MAG TPA: ferritin-like domain-containing protein, partial [Gemmataceae bacterium]|nr:ferritin-like domain-containing protein [Gemmataceae bacterium]